jgi:hypothetical protein
MLWQKTSAAFHAPKPFNTIGKRELIDHRRKQAPITSEASVRRLKGVMARAKPGSYALRAVISGWMPRMFSTRVRL